MNIHEFELRYRAYKGLNYKFNLGRDEKEILNLIKIKKQWVLKKKIQEIWPKELHEITYQTYTTFKIEFLKTKWEQSIKNLDKIFRLTEYIDRLEYELKVIKEMWFNSYFLIVADFIRRSKKHQIIVWPWRWSWAWSLLAWVIRITDINPLPHDLLFERFLNPARISMPDFDIDFEDELRETVINYVIKKYWKEKVCSIWTYMKMATKAAFKDAARAIGLAFDRSNYISNLIPDWSSISEAIHSKDWNEELKNIYNSDKKVQEAVEFWEKLEWNLRQLGVHACGIIIAPEPITTYTWAQYVKDNKELGIVSQFDGPTLETIWLLKMDFLWLRNLSVIKNCIKIITKKAETEWKELPEIFKTFRKEASFYPPQNEKYTFEKVFQTGNTTWIFQFESAGMRRYLIDLKANSLNDLVAMNALYRPWPMEFIPKYIDRKHWREKITYMQNELRTILLQKYNKEEIVEDEKNKLTEDLWPIMNVTYGIAVYQEQLMFLVQSMAWFSLSEADLLRRWIGKKKVEVIEALKKEFIKRWQEFRNYKAETLKFIYEKMIEPAAAYSFNKSHSVCYSEIAYQTWYLKAHYPIAFYAALIRSVEEDTDEMSNYIYEAQLQGIDVLAPHVSYSFNHISAIDGKIRLWFLWIKGIWRDVGESIQEERKKNWIFKSLEDFLKRCEKVINKKSLQSLAKSWALDEFADRKDILENIEQILDRSKSTQNISMWLFGWDIIDTNIVFKNTHKTSMIEKLMMEQDVFKTFVSWHPLDGLYKYIKRYSFISQFKDIENAWAFIIIGYIKDIKRARKKWFFVKVEDISWQMEFFMKDMMNLKKLDIIYIYWYRGRNSSIEKIIRTSHSKLIKQAWGKYDPNMTVTKARKMRRSSKKQNEIITIAPESEPKQTCPKIKEEVKKEKWKNKNSTENIKFQIPESIQKINQILSIIKSNPWNINIFMWSKEFQVNNKWIENIKQLLQ